MIDDIFEGCRLSHRFYDHLAPEPRENIAKEYRKMKAVDVHTILVLKYSLRRALLSSVIE